MSKSAPLHVDVKRLRVLYDTSRALPSAEFVTIRRELFDALPALLDSYEGGVNAICHTLAGQEIPPLTPAEQAATTTARDDYSIPLLEVQSLAHRISKAAMHRQYAMAWRLALRLAYEAIRLARTLRQHDAAMSVAPMPSDSAADYFRVNRQL